MRIKEWSFRSEKVTAERMALLQREFTWDEIVQRIAGEMSDIGFRWKEGEKEAVNNRRVEFVFSVTSETQDIFFNSAYGYRAMHYVSACAGIECTRVIIDSIKEKLVAAARETALRGAGSTRIMKSLDYASAKIWISEDDSTLDQRSLDGQKILALEVPRWVEAMNDVLTAWKTGLQPTPSIKSRALLGVQVPEGNRLKVLGAWMNGHGEEYIVPSKIYRAQHIHEYGFS